jgi:2-iminoacetate synthase ThiH
MRVWAIPVAVMEALLQSGLPGLADILLQGVENRQERAGELRLARTKNHKRLTLDKP